MFHFTCILLFTYSNINLVFVLVKTRKYYRFTISMCTCSKKEKKEQKSNIFSKNFTIILADSYKKLNYKKAKDEKFWQFNYRLKQSFENINNICCWNLMLFIFFNFDNIAYLIFYVYVVIKRDSYILFLCKISFWKNSLSKYKLNLH